jgi:hypothetical protein
MSTSVPTVRASRASNHRSTRDRRRSNGRAGTGVPVISSNLFQTWRRQVACRERLADERGPRPFVLIGHRIRGTISDSLVPLDRLAFLVMFDERTGDDRLTTRLLGFRPALGAAGIRIGGADRQLFEKDVRLAPTHEPGGRRLELADSELTEMALNWEQHLKRLNRHPHYPRRNILRWPSWWCSVAEGSLTMTVRAHHGKALLPLEEAIASGLQVITVYADLEKLPKRQVLACDTPSRALVGQAGLVTFDLFHSRFR